MPRPMAIYLETSFLWRLPLDLDHAIFLTLKEMAERLGIPLFVCALSIGEYSYGKAEETLGNLSKLDGVLEDLGALVEDPPRISLPRDKDAIAAEFDKRLAESLHGHSVGIIETVSVSQDRLIEMALKKARPFEEKGEKGFRDTIILYSILSHARSSGWNSILIVAQDKIFGHEDVRTIAAQEGIRMTAASFEEAVATLKELQTTEFKVWYADRAAILREFLLSQRDLILRFIGDTVHVDEAFLRSGLDVLDVRRIQSVELLDVRDVLPGFLPPDVLEGRAKISFGALLRVGFLGTPYSLSPRPGLSLREGTTNESTVVAQILSGMMRAQLGHTEEEVKHYAVERDLFLTGSVLLNQTGGREVYSDLAIERAGPSGRLGAILRRLSTTETDRTDS